MTAVLLEVIGVTLQYKTPRHLVTATYKVEFTVHQGDRYVILGPSGCGKSTLLKAVGGFMPPVEGSIRIRGREVDVPGPDRMMESLPISPSRLTGSTLRENWRSTCVPAHSVRSTNG